MNAAGGWSSDGEERFAVRMLRQVVVDHMWTEILTQVTALSPGVLASVNQQQSSIVCDLGFVFDRLFANADSPGQRLAYRKALVLLLCVHVTAPLTP